ncbi:MAG: hypothetical protein R3Y06_03030 [Faecalibacterium sp.]
MKKLSRNTFLKIAGLTSIAGTLAACGDTSSTSSAATAGTTDTATQDEAASLGTVVFGIHSGGSANASGFALSQMGFDEKYNFVGELIVSDGPSIYASVTAGEMQAGYLGNGMAWHYFEPDGALSLLTLDAISDDEKLLIRNSISIAPDGEASLDELYAVLPGLTLTVDLTTTPGTFLKSLLDIVNEGRDSQLWFDDIDGAYPSKGSEDKQVIIMNTTNSNATAAMQDTSIDGCIVYGNVSVALMEDPELSLISSPAMHLGDQAIPNTWCVNTEWALANPELCLAFTNAMLDAFDYRADVNNREHLIELAMDFDQLGYDDYIFPSWYLTSAELKEFFATEDGDGYMYLQNIYNSHVGTNGLTEDNMKTIDEAYLGDFVAEACAD